jgi:hypothetical protein
MATDATSLTITAPATSANLGPGFDVLALARPARRAGAPLPGFKGGRLWRRGPDGWSK